MEHVVYCIGKLKPLFDALKAGDQVLIERLDAEIMQGERDADATKRGIRNHLPSSLVLPIDRNSFLDLLHLQDSIADVAEHIANLCSLKLLEFPKSLHSDFDLLLEKVLETFSATRQMMNELDELLNNSFGGIEAEKTCALVDKIAFLEHEAEVLQRRLTKSVIAIEGELSVSSFYIWMGLCEEIGILPHLCEKLAYKMRMLLDLS